MEGAAGRIRDLPGCGTAAVGVPGGHVRPGRPDAQCVRHPARLGVLSEVDKRMLRNRRKNICLRY